jgi:hypothetical protein
MPAPGPARESAFDASPGGDPYLAWRAETGLAADALRSWNEAAPADRAAAYAAYRATADREEAAVRELARATGRATPTVTSGRWEVDLGLAGMARG